MLDIILIILLLLGSYRGYKKGFLKQLFSFLMIVIGYILSFVLASRLFLLLPNFLPIEDNKYVSGFNETLSNLNIAPAYNKVILFFVLFFGIRIILKVIFNSVGIVTKLPIIKTVNKSLGAILGFLEFYIVIFVVIYFLYIIPLDFEWKTYLYDSKIANLIFEKTPILSKSILEEFFNYHI